MKNTWFSIGFIVYSSWPYYKGGFEVSSLTIQRVGLRFHAHLLKISSRPAKKLKKTLGSRKNRRSNQLQVRKAETGNIQWVRIIRIPLGRINLSMHSDYPTLQNTRRILGGSITQRACFSETKIYFRLGLSDARQNEGRTKARVILQRACFLGWVFSL